jgi:hypothetical protein
MAIKPALFGASQSSSFGHLRPPPQTSVTTTHNCTPLHNPLHANTVLYSTQESCQAAALGALDKALDKWYNTGVGLNESITAAIKEHNDND